MVIAPLPQFEEGPPEPDMGRAAMGAAELAQVLGDLLDALAAHGEDVMIIPVLDDLALGALHTLLVRLFLSSLARLPELELRFHLLAAKRWFRSIMIDIT